MKRSKWSKLLAAIIAFVMIAAMLPVGSVFAASESVSASAAESVGTTPAQTEAAEEEKDLVSGGEDLAGESSTYYFSTKPGTNADWTATSGITGYSIYYVLSDNSTGFQDMTKTSYTDDGYDVYSFTLDSSATLLILRAYTGESWDSANVWKQTADITGDVLNSLTSGTNNCLYLTGYVSQSDAKKTVAAKTISVATPTPTSTSTPTPTTDPSSYVPVTSISLTYAGAAQVVTGGTFMISSDVVPADATDRDSLTWYVSNNLASINQTGVVTAGNTPGSVEIYATITNSAGNKETIKSNTITLDIVSRTAVQGVSLSPENVIIRKAKTAQLTASVLPTDASQGVTWTSNNPSVATVNGNGLVTGVRAGTATITATSTADSTKSATSVITVTDSTVLYYLAPTSWGSSAYVYLFNSDTDVRSGYFPAMTLENADNYLYDGATVPSGYNLFSISIDEKNNTPYAYAIFVTKDNWTDATQFPVRDDGGLATTPENGGNAYTNGDKTGHTVTLKSLQSIEVTPESKTIAASGAKSTTQLTATATYAGGATRDISGAGVTWTSSDPAVATVSSAGLVTGITAGEVTITATSTADSSISDSAAITVANARPTGVTLTPAESTILPNTTLTLTASYEPEYVDEENVNLTWSSSDDTIATVDEDGVVTGVANGTVTITATVTGQTEVKGTATVTVEPKTSRIYYYAALSKLSYEGSASTSGSCAIPLNSSSPVYAYVWSGNNTSDGQLITLQKLGATSANGISYADGDIYYADNVVGTYDHIVFANGNAVSATNLYGYGQGTAQLSIPSDVTNPCFYAGTGDDSVYSNATGKRPGYWASLYTVYDPERITGTSVVSVNSGTKPDYDTNIEANTNAVNGTSNATSNRKITYIPSTLYDYYSDYELNGKEKSTDKNSTAMQTQRNWVTFREFDQAVSDYYAAAGTSTGDVIYTGHFQPDALSSSKFSSIAGTLNLYGYDNNYLPFFTINNSNHDTAGNGGKYSDAAQGLVNSSLAGFVSGTLGTGVLNMEDNSTDLPHFNKSFLQGANSKNAILGSVYEDVQFPFTQEDDPYYTGVKYYTFDSARESVFLHKDSSDVYYLEDMGLYDNAQNVDSGSGTSGVSSTYGYFPFNEDSSSRNARTYDYGFGTKLEFKFKLGENGDVESNGSYNTAGKVPTIFKFSGDDDVWVFIDGQLVLDLGGSHGQVQGAINFSTDLDGTALFPSKVSNSYPSYSVAKQSVTVSGTKADGLTSQSISLSNLNLWDGGEHVLTLYYMERGMWESNMMIQTNVNFQNTINIQKEWENYNGKALADSKKKTVYAVLKRSYGDNAQEFVPVDSTKTNGEQYLIRLDSANDWRASYSVDEYVNGHSDEESYKYSYYVYEVQVDSLGVPQYDGTGTDRTPKIYSSGAKMVIGTETYQVSGGGKINGSTGTITNTRQAGSTVSITKAWEGVPDSAASSILPENVYVKMYSYDAGQSETDAVEVTGTTSEISGTEANAALFNENNVITLNATNNWTATFIDLTTSKTYFFKEVTNAQGTKVKSTGDSIVLTGKDNKQYQFTISSETLNGAQTITNTIMNPKISITLKKEWAETTETLKPSTVSLYLKRTGTVSGTEVTQYYNTSGFVADSTNASPITVSSNGSWQTVLNDLDVISDAASSSVWTYSVYLETSGEYTAETDGGKTKLTIGNTSFEVSYGSAVSGTTDGSNPNQTGKITVTNTQLPEVTLNLKKVWLNDFGNDVTTEHDETVSVYLMRYTGTESEKANIGYYKLTDGIISFVNAENDATAIELSKDNAYAVSIEHLPKFQDDEKTTAWHYALTDETYASGGTTYNVTDGKITIGENEYHVTYNSIDASAETLGDVTVTNKLIGKYTMPTTGGAGKIVLPWIIVGAALIAAAVVMKKKREAQ